MLPPALRERLRLAVPRVEPPAGRPWPPAAAMPGAVAVSAAASPGSPAADRVAHALGVPAGGGVDDAQKYGPFTLWSFFKSRGGAPYRLDELVVEWVRMGAVDDDRRVAAWTQALQRGYVTELAIDGVRWAEPGPAMRDLASLLQ